MRWESTVWSGAGDQLFNESVQVRIVICLPENETASTERVSTAAIRSGKLVQVNLLTKLVEDWLTEGTRFAAGALLPQVGSVLPEKKTEYDLDYQ